jgi:hypothetical protein
MSKINPNNYFIKRKLKSVHSIIDQIDNKKRIADSYKKLKKNIEESREVEDLIKLCSKL